jgi:outer membrane protein assembly factor BamB
MRVQARLVSVVALSVIAAVNISFADWPMFGGNPQRKGLDAAGNSLGTAEGVAGSGKAVLYAFDAETGKELFNSGDTLNSFTHFGGLALSNGRIFVTTWDGFVYAFGLKQEDR